jgi:hypothetical protein
MRLAPLIVLVLLVTASAAEAQCGEAYRRPAGAPAGVAPLAIGDSVMIGAARQLARRGLEVDARCARNPREGLDLLKERRRRGKLPEIVVFALGTNIAVTSADIRRALRVLGRRRTLMLVTPFRSGRPFYTGPMRRAARKRPRRVKLIDWSSRASRNRHWIAGDGTHVTPSGAEAYARLLKRAAWSRQRGRFGRR